MSDTVVHHPYSPSTLGSLEVCPAYEGRQSDTPHERTTAGTLAHKVVESGVDDNKLGDDDAIAAAECLDFVEQRRKLLEDARAKAVESLGVKYWGTRVPKGVEADVMIRANLETPEILELKEVYLPIDDKTFTDFRTVQKTVDGKFVSVRERMEVKATTAGYVDRVLIDHTRTYAELLDWKFGLWAVESADKNPQGIAYTLGLFKMFPSLKSVRVWFKQPHIGLTTEAHFHREHVEELYLRIQTIVARARAARDAGDFATANPTVPVCNFCANIGKCPKVAEFACKVGSKFHPLEIPSEITPTMVLTERDTQLAMRLSQVMAVWAKAFRTQTTDRILRGDATIPKGFELQQRSNREVVNESMFRQVALTGYLTQEEYSKITPVPGFGAIEDAIIEKAPRGHKKAAVEEFQKTLEASGAVKRGQPYVFLKATSEK